MNFKNWKKSVNSEEKTHFKMYKSGKIWKVAGITLVGFGLFGGATTVVNDQLSGVVYAATTDYSTQITEAKATADKNLGEDEPIAKKNITNALNIPAEKKAEILSNLDKIYKAAQAAIIAATNDANTANTDGSTDTKIENLIRDITDIAMNQSTEMYKLYRDYPALSKVITDATDAVDKNVANQVANADPALTQDQIDELNRLAEALKSKIKGQKDIDALNKVLEEEKNNPTVVPPAAGPTVEELKTTAIATVNEALDITTKAIADDPTLPAAEKEKQTTAAEKAAEKVISDINAKDNATDIDTVLDTENIVKTTDPADPTKVSLTSTTIATHTSGTPVDEQKTKQTEAIDKILKKTIDEINQDPTLTTAEKVKQVGDALSATKKVKDAINDSSVTTADQIGAIVKAETDKPTIKPTHVKGKEIVATKDDAKRTIDQVQKDTIQSINDDPDLTTAEKITRVADAIKAANKVKEDLDDPAVTTAQDVKSIVDKQTTTALPVPTTATIKSAHTPGTPVATTKDDAKKTIDQVQKDTIQGINDDPNLTTAEKIDRVADAIKAANKVKEDLDDPAVTTAQDVKSIVDKQTTTALPVPTTATIKSAHTPGTPVATTKDDAKKTIDQVQKDTIQGINDDPNLTTAEKIDRVADAIKAANKVKEDLDDPAVTTAQDVKSIVDKQTTTALPVPTTATIKSAHTPGTPVATAKDDAKKAIDQVQKDTIQGINDDPTLTTAEKIKKVGEALSATKKAKDAIDDPAVDTAQKVKELLDDETTTVTPTPKTATIKSTHTAGPTVDELKDTADKTLDTVEKKTIAAINGDDTLTPTEKAKQVEDTKVANAKVKTALADPTVKTADQIKAILDRETSTANPAPTDQVIAPSHKPGASVADQKKKALEDITKTAETAKNDIDKDATKTQAEKDADKAAVDKKAAELTDAVNKSKTATDIEKPATETETPTLPDLHKPGTPLDKQKADKIGAINDKLSDVISAITNDPTISEADKNDQITKAQNIANTLINQVNDSKNADEIKAINPDYVDTHVSGESLDSKKDKIKDQVQAALDETKDAINADTTLTEEEKADQIATAEETATAILNDLDAATTLEQVNQAETAVPTIYDSHVEGDLKDTANESTPGTTNTSLPGNQVATNSALPQTSEKNQSIMSLVGLGLLSGLALFGLAYRKRKD